MLCAAIMPEQMYLSSSRYHVELNTSYLMKAPLWPPRGAECSRYATWGIYHPLTKKYP
jgi:hypothetical protein